MNFFLLLISSCIQKPALKIGDKLYVFQLTLLEFFAGSIFHHSEEFFPHACMHIHSVHHTGGSREHLLLKDQEGPLLGQQCVNLSQCFLSSQFYSDTQSTLQSMIREAGLVTKETRTIKEAAKECCSNPYVTNVLWQVRIYHCTTTSQCENYHEVRCKDCNLEKLHEMNHNHICCLFTGSRIRI